jgi:hypothetical protein
MYLKFQNGGFICWRLERIFLINDSYSWHLMDLRKVTLRQPANNQDLYAVFWYQLAGWKASMLSPLHAVSLTWGSILSLHCPFYVLSSFKLSHQSILQKSLNYVLGPWVTSIFSYILYFGGPILVIQFDRVPCLDAHWELIKKLYHRIIIIFLP